MFRLGVGAIVVNHDGSVIVGKRRAGGQMTSNYWGMPQGGIDEGEDIQQTFWRELKEETSITGDLIDVVSHTDFCTYYEFPPDVWNEGVAKNFAGQKHYWFYATVKEGKKIDPSLLESDEFSEICWMSPSELLKSCLPFKRDVYRTVFSYFKIEFGE